VLWVRSRNVELQAKRQKSCRLVALRLSDQLVDNDYSTSAGLTFRF
jgi:hypothetical protein